MKSSVFRHIILPLIAVSLILIGSGYLVYHIERSLISARVTQNLQAASNQIVSHLNSVYLGAEGLKAFFIASEEVAPEEYNQFAAILHQDYSQIGIDLTLNWIDPKTNLITYVYPLSPTNKDVVNLNVSEYENQIQPIKTAKATKQALLSDPLLLVQGPPGIIVFNPIYNQDKDLGIIVATIPLPDLIKAISWHNGQYPLLQYQINGYYTSENGDALFTKEGNQIIDAKNNTSPDYRYTPPTPINNDEFITHSFTYLNQEWLLTARATKPPIFSSPFFLAYSISAAVIWCIGLFYLTNNFVNSQKLRQLAQQEHQHNLELHQHHQITQQKAKEIETKSLELQQKTAELTKMNNFMINRELQMTKLKAELERLRTKNKDGVE